MKKVEKIDNECYIEFLNKEKGFKKDVKHFSSYEEAVKWGRENFERFNSDMIHYKMAKGSSVDILHEYGSIHYEQKDNYKKGQLVVIKNNELGKHIIKKISKIKKGSNGEIYSTINGQDYPYSQILGVVINRMAKGGGLESELPSDIEQLVSEGKVTYRGMGFGVSGTKIKAKGKEYIISDEKFKQLGGISKIKFGAPLRKLENGATIKGSEVSLHLPIEMSVYVPSTKNANIPISKSELSKRVNEVKEYLANLFGGYSSSQIIGGYASNEGSLIQEDVVKVISFATKKAYEENKQKLIDKIANWSKLWSQESIGFELEGDLYYINQNKKMAKGGNTDCGCHKKMANGGNTDCGCWHYEIGGL